MIRAGEFSELVAFAAVAEMRSFRRAATALALKPSTLSHAVQALEARLGVRLLARTTRVVAPTAAGAVLLAGIAPALAALNAAAELVAPHRARPQGTLRISVPQGVVDLVLAPMIGAFVRDFPDIILDIVVDDGFHDIVQDGFDAGIRLGESVARGMTAVRVSADIAGAVVATPAYWEANGKPLEPGDLLTHRCIRRRFAVGRGIGDWQFQKDGETMAVTVSGPLVATSDKLILQAALDGVGTALLAEGDVAGHIENGRLARVLEGWCPPMFAFFLYHSSQRLPSASLLALINVLAVR